MRQMRSACLALPLSVRSLSAVKSVRPEPVEGLFFLLASFKKDGASTGSARTDHKIASGRKLRRIFVAIAVAQADLVDLFAAQLGERRVGQPDLRRHLEGREMFAQESGEPGRVGLARSEERRVGEECVRTCRSQW